MLARPRHRDDDAHAADLVLDRALDELVEQLELLRLERRST